MVVIIDVDNSLYSADFRASERLGQIIVQVAGRAGRSDKPGEVYLQTHNPEHPLLAKLIESGYSHFADTLLTERKSALLPPYSHLILFRAEATDASMPNLFLSDVRTILQKDEFGLQIFGPVPALMEKKAGKFRAQLLIQASQRSVLQKSLQPSLSEIESLPSGRKVRWSLDVDPLDIF
jgi:primosomal protein N' (replication factor Y)